MAALPGTLPVHMRVGPFPETHIGDLEVNTTTTGTELVERMPALLCQVAAAIDSTAGPVGLVRAWEQRADELDRQARRAAAGDLEDRVRARGLDTRAGAYRAFALELREALGLPNPGDPTDP